MICGSGSGKRAGRGAFGALERPARPSPAPPFHRQPFFTIQAMELLVVHGSPRVRATRRSADNRNGSACPRSASSLRGSTDGPAGVRAKPSWDRHRPACTPGAARCHDPASPAAPHHAARSGRRFFPGRSFGTAPASIASASRRSSSAFSSSSIFGRFTSESPMPPYHAGDKPPPSASRSAWHSNQWRAHASSRSPVMQ